MVLPKGTPEREGHSHLPLCRSSCQEHGGDAVCSGSYLGQESQGHPGSETVVKVHSLVADDFMKPPQTVRHLQASFTE